MKKNSQNAADLSSLVSNLLGQNVDLGGGESGAEVSESMNYQLPVKHNIKGEEISEEIKPTNIGHFSSKPIYRSVDKKHRPHWGVDLAAPKGSPVYPIAPGIVFSAQDQDVGPAGKHLYIVHEDGAVVSKYSHLDSVNVNKDQKVSYNTIIGGVGDTGNAKGTSPHLHYEVSVPGEKGVEAFQAGKLQEFKYMYSMNRVNPSGAIGQAIGSLRTKSEIIRSLITKFNAFTEEEDLSKDRINKFKSIIEKFDEKKQ